MCSPRGGSARLGRSSAGGWGGGWGGCLCAVPPDCAAGGASGAGGRLASVRPSAFPGQATKRVSLASLCPWRAWPPYRSGSCPLAVPGRGPCGALVWWRGFACPSWFLREQAAGAWGRALLRPPSRAPRSCRGEGGSSPLPLGGRGPAPPWLAGLRGGSAPWLPTSLSAGGGLRPSAQSPFRRRRILPRCTRSVGVVGQPRAPAGGGGWPVSRPPGGVAGGPGGRGVVLPRSVPVPSLGGQHCGRHWRRSGHGGRGAHTAPVRCRLPPPGVARASFLRAGAGTPACCDPRGSTRWGARGRATFGSRCVPPPGVTVPSGGGGTSPRPRGGLRAGAPVARRPGGGVGGRGEGGPRRCSPPPCPRGGPWPPSLSPFFSGAPPLGIHVRPGLPGGRGRRARPGRPPVGQCGGGGGGGRSRRHGLPQGLPQAGNKAGRFVCAFLGAAVPLWPTAPAESRRSAAGIAGVCGRSTGGAWRAAALAAALASPPWVQRPHRQGAGPPSLRPASGRSRAGGEGGEGGGGGWEGGGVPRSPPLDPWRPPRRPRGGGLVVPVPGGQPPTGGAHSSPAPLYPLGAGPSCRPLLGLPALLAVAAWCRLAGGGGGPVSAGGGGSGQRSRVSGLRGSGPPLALVAPVLPSTGPLCRAVRWEVCVGRGARLRRGGASRGTVPFQPPRAHHLGRRGEAVTCAVACVGAGAGAVAGSAGGSASGRGRCAKPGGASCWHLQ